MATRELDKEGAERQVLRYRFAVRKLSPVHSLKARCSSGGFFFAGKIHEHPCRNVWVCGKCMEMSFQTAEGSASWPVPSTS